jgi:hypothetical protein
MEHIFIAAQFLAVVFVAHERSKVRSPDTRSSVDARNKNNLALFGVTQPGKFTDEEV